MRNDGLVGSEDDYEAGHANGYHVNPTWSDSRDPDGNAVLSGHLRSLIWVVAVRTYPEWGTFLLIWPLTVEHVAALKNLCFFAHVFRAVTITFYGPVHIKW